MKEYAAGLQQVYMRYDIHDEESAAGLQQTLHHTERVCGKSAASLGRPAADSSSYWKSMRQVCSKSAADLPQTLHHTERVCGKSAVSLRQTCRRLFIILKEYAASLRQSAAKLICMWKRWLSAASLLQICGKSAAGVCGRLISFLW